MTIQAAVAHQRVEYQQYDHLAQSCHITVQNVLKVHKTEQGQMRQIAEASLYSLLTNSRWQKKHLPEGISRRQTSQFSTDSTVVVESLGKPLVLCGLFTM